MTSARCFTLYQAEVDSTHARRLNRPLISSAHRQRTLTGTHLRRLFDSAYASEPNTRSPLERLHPGEHTTALKPRTMICSAFAAQAPSRRSASTSHSPSYEHVYLPGQQTGFRGLSHRCDAPHGQPKQPLMMPTGGTPSISGLLL